MGVCSPTGSALATSRSRQASAASYGGCREVDPLLREGRNLGEALPRRRRVAKPRSSRRSHSREDGVSITAVCDSPRRTTIFTGTPTRNESRE